MDLTLQQIYDYNVCPMLYKFKYQMKLGIRSEPTLLERYDDSIHKTIMFYYYQILNGKQPSQEQVRQKFGSLFYKGMDIKDILNSSTIDRNMNAFNLQGIKALDTFYEKEFKRSFTPIGVDMDIRVPVDDQYLVTTIDLVREIRYEEKPLVEIVNFTTTTKAADPFAVNHNIELTAGSYAFRKLFKATENRVIMTYMKSGKEYISVRKDPELKKFEAIVHGVGKAIEEDRFYPVLNTRCNYCPYRDVCDKYKF
jgi:CRISPR/Cas system-associated exonuclease Cas4 (RecB family)